MYFIELLQEIDNTQIELWNNVYKECNELISIMVASIGTVRNKLKK